MKTAIWISVTVLSTLGSWLGTTIDHGNWLGGWSLILGTIGSGVGIWVGYKIGRNY